jgi:opacity protein-like surface antigen
LPIYFDSDGGFEMNCSNDARSLGSSCLTRALAPRGTAIGGIAIAIALLASSAAQAQNCTTLPTNIGNLGNIVGTTAAVVGSVASSITTVNTAFLTQSSAYVSAPSNPQPGQEASGIWVRGVGGEVNVKSESNTGATFLVPAVPGANTSGAVSCNTEVRQTYGGVQVGRDIGKLNINGWNFHFGTTAGYIEGDTKTTNGSLTSNVQVPFAGIYGAVTYDRFFADIVVRGDYYQNSMNSPALNIFNQNFNAHGISVSGSAGYQFSLPNNWFLEPSVGLMHSSVKVDAINTIGAPPVIGGVFPVSGTIAINEINTTIGRIGARVGTTVNYGAWVLQPFASISVWHDFADNVTANYTACCSLVFNNGVNNPATLSQSFSGQNVGTYGQYSLGISGQLANTGWLGFVRVDYRNGDRIDGVSGTGGIRYQFAPDLVAANRPAYAKAPILKAPMPAPVSWGGFYVGGFLGADYGQARWGIPGFGSVDPHGAGILGGVQGGYNWQVGSWVYGIEGDWGATNFKGAQGCSPLGLGIAFFNTTCNASADWIATLTGRVGMTWNRALLYVKGGVAWTDADYSLTCNAGPLNGTLGVNDNCRNRAGALVNTLTASNSTTGFTVGFGSEFALTPNWSAKAEYDYIDFGDRNLTAADGSVFNLGLRVSQVKVGMNYRFNAR